MRTDATKYAHWVQVGLCIAIAIFILTAVLMIVAVIRDAFAGAALASSKDLISPLVASTGVLIAVLAYSRDRGKIEREREEAKSKIFAEQAKQSLQDAIELLEDRNQDRATWVRAARLILEAKKLGEAIPSADYKRVYELAAARVRHELNRVFIVKDEKTGLEGRVAASILFRPFRLEDDQANLESDGHFSIAGYDGQVRISRASASRDRGPRPFHAFCPGHLSIFAVSS